MDAEINWRVTLAAIVKDEADYIVDWLCYHLSIGVEHFFIYDNGSTDNTVQLLRKFINGGVVTLISWPMKGGQVDAYSHAIKLLTGKTEWLGFLDADEFLVMHEHHHAYEFLKALDADQILIPWRNFPYSGHYAAPGGGSLENFFWAYRIGPDGLSQVKQFVRPEMVKQVTAHFSFIAGHRTKLSTGEDQNLTHAVANPSYQGAQINHYATRSYLENETRLKKGMVSGSAHKRLDDFVPLTPSLAEKMDYDSSVLKHLAKFKRERIKWARVADYPHRFGLHQHRAVLPSFNNLVFYLSKSFANYLTGQQAIKPLSDMRFIQTLSTGAKMDLAPQLIGYKKSVMYFDIEKESFLKYFLGTIHYGDFVRRFGFDCLEVDREVKIEDKITKETSLTGQGYVALINIEIQIVTTISLSITNDQKVIVTEALPPGRHGVIVYVPTVSTSEGATIELQLCGQGFVREMILGTVH